MPVRFVRETLLFYSESIDSGDRNSFAEGDNGGMLEESLLPSDGDSVGSSQGSQSVSQQCRATLRQYVGVQTVAVNRCKFCFNLSIGASVSNCFVLTKDAKSIAEVRFAFEIMPTQQNIW